MFVQSCFLLALIVTVVRGAIQWNASSHFMIFVGGHHHSGTSVTERLLSSQDNASGIEVYMKTVLPRVNTCRINDKKYNTCFIQEHEGRYLTMEFDYLAEAFHGRLECRIGVVDYWHFPFRERFKDTHAALLGPEKVSILRDRLLDDWGLGLDFSQKYLVVKDIENAVRGSFLQEVFGKDRTAFVFALRHPMGACRYFQCHLEIQLLSWLNLYETMLRDLEKLENYVVFHSEALVTSPAVVTNALKQLLGWKELVYSNSSTKKPHEKKTGKTRSRRSLRSEGSRGLSGSDSNELFPDDDDETSDSDYSADTVSRKLPYLQFGAGKDLVILSQSDGTKRWNATYMAYFNKNDRAQKLLKYYEKSINRFCYSIYDWNIHCDSPIFRMKVQNKK